jgi:transposase
MGAIGVHALSLNPTTRPGIVHGPHSGPPPALSALRSLDLEPFSRGYINEEGGPPAYDPALMLKLLLYGNCDGVTSSRRIERATVEDEALKCLAAKHRPTVTTVARFRERNLSNLSELIDRVVDLCRKAGMVRLGRVALD